MEIITRYHVTISDGTGILCEKNKYEVNQYSVIGENDMFLCIDDWRFTTIKKIGDKYSTYETVLNKPILWSAHSDKVWGNRVTYTLHTDRTKRESSIRAEIQRYIDREYGFFLRGVDLSFITKGEAA